MRKEPKCPVTVERHPLRDDIDKWLLRGDSPYQLEKWLDERDLKVSRQTLAKYKEWLFWHRDKSFADQGGLDNIHNSLSIAKAEGAATVDASAVAALNEAVAQFEQVDWSQISESEKVRYGIQSIGVLQDLKNDREDLQDRKRIALLEQLMAAIIKGEMQDVLVGIKDEVRRKKLEEDAIDAEYSVKADDS